MNTTQILDVSYWISDLLREELVYCCLLLAFLVYDPTMTVSLCRLVWRFYRPVVIPKMLIMFAAFFMANYFGKGFSKVLSFFVTEPRVAEPLKPSGRKERLETIEEVDEEEGSDEVEEPPAPAPIQPQQGGGGNRGKKPKNKKNRRKGKR
ncbi:hypothetical protein CSPX01_10915 [Colletotrichum filicis]|nr:hypothetical protein CSPX01_10915 [Colletotrichum filicis]